MSQSERSQQEITLLLNRMASGDRTAADELAPLIYQELHNLAKRHIGRERAGHTLQVTALVNEVYLKMGSMPQFNGRRHFLAIISLQMRRILIDYARARKARVEGRMEPDGEELLVKLGTSKPKELIELNEALERLEKSHPRAARVVEMKFFGGLLVEEIAEELGLTSRTVKRDWALAQAKLKLELAASAGQ